MTALTPIETISPLSTNLVSGFAHVTMVTGFSYGLLSDKVSYDIYSAQVADTSAYTVVAQDTIN